MQAEAFISRDLFDRGLNYVVVSRRKSGGRIEAGVFLLDVFCLGVKDAFLFSGSEREFDSLLVKLGEQGALDKHPASTGRKLVEGGVHYAKKLGFAPDRNYKKAARVFGGIDPSECDEVFTYGKDGKPFFIRGPYMSDIESQAIIAQLSRVCGEGNFNYIIAISAHDNDLDMDMDEEVWEPDDKEESNWLQLCLSDSASKGKKPKPDALDWARETIDQLDLECSMDELLFMDMMGINLSETFLSIASNFLEEYQQEFKEFEIFQSAEDQLQFTLSILMACLAFINARDDELNEELLGVNWQSIIEFKKKISTEYLIESLPPFTVLYYKYISAEQTKNGKPRLLTLLVPRSD